MGIGYFWRIREDEQDTDGLFLDGSLDTSWDFKRGAISLVASAGFDSEDFGAENLGFNEFYGVTGRAYYDFSRYLGGDLSAGYLRQEFTDIDEDRNIYRATASLSYRIHKWVSLRFGYTYNRVDSNVPENDFEDHRVLFNIDFGYDRGYPIKLYP
jgi:uncharacterized protein (PEP-CTERM system associated)